MEIKTRLLDPGQTMKAGLRQMDAMPKPAEVIPAQGFAISLSSTVFFHFVNSRDDTDVLIELQVRVYSRLRLADHLSLLGS